MSCSFFCTLEANIKRDTQKYTRRKNERKEKQKKEKSLNANSIKID